MRGDTKPADFFTLTKADGFALKSHGYVGMTRATWPAEFTIGGPVNDALLNFTNAIADIGILLSGQCH
jgi:hypothetical protein